jgi:hypothetical protein
MASMPVARLDFPLVTYGDAVFAIGGYASGGYLSRVDRWTQTYGWVQAKNSRDHIERLGRMSPS